MMSIHRKDYHDRIGTYIIRTKWGNRMKRKYIDTSKQNSEIISGSVNIQNDLIYFSLPSNDTFFFQVDLKELAVELGPVFAHLFQQSIDTGEIPKEWSLANICPLFKKGDRSLARNYRPVSLTCIPCKLLEHIVCSNIMAHLDEHELLSDRQHAFRKWHSCETQLTTVINDWAKILDKKGQVDTFILDFEKALKF